MNPVELPDADLEQVTSGKEAMYQAQGLPPNPYNKVFYTDDFNLFEMGQLVRLRRQWRQSGGTAPVQQYLPSGRPLLFGR
jgi:hypothetical protein